MKRNWKGVNILIVEDDLSLLEVLSDFVQMTGATVFQADNGQIALDYLVNEKIDFVLSDIQMPVMDGIELLKIIREKHTGIPIVLLATGQSLLTNESALASGASGLIHKPFVLNEIATKMDELLKSANII